jgi:hypothetical protein
LVEAVDEAVKVAAAEALATARPGEDELDFAADDLGGGQLGGAGRGEEAIDHALGLGDGAIDGAGNQLRREVLAKFANVGRAAILDSFQDGVDERTEFEAVDVFN